MSQTRFDDTADDTDYMETSGEMFRKQQEFMKAISGGTNIYQCIRSAWPRESKLQITVDVENSTDVLLIILKPWQVTAIA